MNILVVGCGKVGGRLASVLSREGHDVCVVDKSEENFAHLDSEFSGFTNCGIPIDQDVLRRAGIENCDALAAVSPDDNVNIMVSQLAKEVFHVPHVLARIYDPNREIVFSHFGLHTVCPTNLTVAAVRSALTEMDKPQLVNFGSHTISFTTEIISKALINEYVSKIDLAKGQSIYGVIHEDLDLEIYNGQKIKLKATDKVIISNLVD